MSKSSLGKQLKDKLEQGIVIFFMLFYSGAWLYQDSSVDAPPEDGLRKSIFILSYGAIVLLIHGKWKHFAYVFTRDTFLLLLIVIALGSVFWSDSSESTLSNAKGLIRLTAFGVYIAMRYSFREQLKLLAWTGSIAALLSLTVCLVLPSQGIHQGEFLQGWRGIYSHKNELAEVMALGATASIFAATNSKHSWIMRMGLCLPVILLILSNANAPLVAFLVILTLIPLRKILLRQHYSLQMFLLITLVLIGGGISMWILENTEGLFNALGKEATFSGRTQIWNTLIGIVLQRPLLGYGYSGFWSNPSNLSYFLQQLSSSGWQPGHAHSAYFELALSLGFVGLLLFLGSFLKALLRGITQVRITRSVEGLWPVSFLIFTSITSVTGGVLPSPSSLTWLLYVTVSLSMVIQQNRAKRNRIMKPDNLEPNCGLKI